MASKTAAECLIRQLGLHHLPLDSVTFVGDPITAVNSSFRLGVVAQTSIALSALSASYLQSLRLHQDACRKVTVDARHAVIEFKAEVYRDVQGNGAVKSFWDPLSGLYETGNGMVRLHTNWPHHKQGLLKILGCSGERSAVEHALRSWDAVEFETVAASDGMCATALRSFDEWNSHPQAEAIRNTLPVQVIKRGDAPIKIDGAYLPLSSPPLTGVRVLELTRVLAGPVCGRTLAAYGAEVEWVTSPNLPDLPELDADTSRGKTRVFLDLDSEKDRDCLRHKTAKADVFLQGYRPGGLQSKGFGVEDLIKLRPGLVCANIAAYGFEGPWKDRRGFDSLTQTATGFNVDEGRAFSPQSRTLAPRAFPMQALDHAAGYFLALGINTALAKTYTEGGSWEVRVSLAAVGQWVRSLGRIDARALEQCMPLPSIERPLDAEVESVRYDTLSPDGVPMRAVKHAAVFSD